MRVTRGEGESGMLPRSDVIRPQRLDVLLGLKSVVESYLKEVFSFLDRKIRFLLVV
jgi:hypothetical protein